MVTVHHCQRTGNNNNTNKKLFNINLSLEMSCQICNNIMTHKATTLCGSSSHTQHFNTLIWDITCITSVSSIGSNSTFPSAILHDVLATHTPAPMATKLHTKLVEVVGNCLVPFISLTAALSPAVKCWCSVARGRRPVIFHNIFFISAGGVSLPAACHLCTTVVPPCSLPLLCVTFSEFSCISPWGTFPG